MVAIEIIISDTGCGISADRLESIFREFEQVESTPPKPNSPGLGESTKLEVGSDNPAYMMQ